LLPNHGVLVAGDIGGATAFALTRQALGHRHGSRVRQRLRVDLPNRRLARTLSTS